MHGHPSHTAHAGHAHTGLATATLDAAAGAPGRDPRAQRRRLAAVLCLAAGYSATEMAGSVTTGSLALLADAFHLISDVGALALALFALFVSQRPRTAERTFGHTRAEILAALANGSALCLLAGIVAFRAVERLAHPSPVAGLGVVGFATGALLTNVLSMWILSGGRHQSLNVRGAWLHVASDAAGSLGVIVAGLCVWFFGWLWADPAASLLIATLILHAAWSLVRDALHILMEGAPRHLDVHEIRGAIAALPAVHSVHDLHVWTIGSGEISLSSHVVSHGHGSARSLLPTIQKLLADRFGIRHATVQIERLAEELGNCAHACDEDPTDEPNPGEVAAAAGH